MVIQNSAALRLAKMHKNKKAAVDWMIIVGAIIALLILGVTIYFIGQGASSANKNLQTFQDCGAQRGHCEALPSACQQGETALYRALGCGNDKYCCLPPPA